MDFLQDAVPEAGDQGLRFRQIVSHDTVSTTTVVGVMKALLLLESSYDRKRLVNAQQYLPLLDRISKNETYLHQARLRAASLADEIRAAK